MTTTTTAPFTPKPFTKAIVDLGVKATTHEIGATEALLDFHLKLKRHGVDLANIKEYRVEFDNVALAYLDTKHKGFSAWLEGAKDLKGTAESPFIKPSTGKYYTKRECEALVRALRARRVDTYEKHLNKEVKKKGERVERTQMERDVIAIYPRMAAFQKLETPTQYELEHIKLQRAVLEHAIAHDPKAKQAYVELEKKATKAIK